MYIVSVKPADGPGPILVSDHPEVLRAVLGAIANYYDPSDVRHREALRLIPTPPAPEEA